MKRKIEFGLPLPTFIGPFLRAAGARGIRVEPRKLTSRFLASEGVIELGVRRSGKKTTIRELQEVFVHELAHVRAGSEHGERFICEEKILRKKLLDREEG